MCRLLYLIALSCVLVSIGRGVSLSGCGPTCMIYCQFGYETNAAGCRLCKCRKEPETGIDSCSDGQVPLSGYVCNATTKNSTCPPTYYCSMTSNDDSGVCCPRRWKPKKSTRNWSSSGMLLHHSTPLFSSSTNTIPWFDSFILFTSSTPSIHIIPVASFASLPLATLLTGCTICLFSRVPFGKEA